MSCAEYLVENDSAEMSEISNVNSSFHVSYDMIINEKLISTVVYIFFVAEL